MSDTQSQLTCKLCGAPCGDGKPWFALLSICSIQSSSEFSWELCELCYQQVKRAIIGVMQQNLLTETAKLKQHMAGLEIG